MRRRLALLVGAVVAGQLAVGCRESGPQPNPVPAISSVSPASATAAAAFTLTVDGRNFVPASSVVLNGTALTTSYQSATRLTALVPAAAFTAAGTGRVAVVNPPPGGGTSGDATVSIDNPVPALTRLSPRPILIGEGAVTLRITGGNFVSTSVVQWNGAALPTQYVDASQLTAAVPASASAAPTSATVTVLNPTPGGGLSPGLPLDVSMVVTPPGSALSRAALDDYLSHSLVMDTWAVNTEPLVGDALQQHTDNLRMVVSIGARHVQWAAGFFWARRSYYNVEPTMTAAAQVAEDLHTQDPGIIVGAGIFETTSPLVDQIAIPAWVFEEFNQPVTVRNFEWTKMAYADQRPSDGNPDTPAIDITQLEARMWYFYWARRYIEIGYEDLHLGEVFTVTRNDIPGYRSFWEVIQRIRRYAAEHARRGFVLVNAQSYPADGVGQWDSPAGVHGIVSADGYLALDYLYAPLRPKENPSSPQDATLARWQDNIFGRSVGGISPNGWTCEHSPYSVSLDPGALPNPGVPIGWPFVWGWAEWAWWVNQPQPYRQDWLWYAVAWLAKTDPNGHLRMPGMGGGGGRPGIDWYHANTPWYSQTDPKASGRNSWLYGFDDEPAIKAVLSATADPRLLNGTFGRPALTGGLTEVVAPEVPSWSFADTAGVARSGSAFVGPLALAAGQQVAFISGTGSITQLLVFPGGKPYQLRLNTAVRTVGGISDQQSLTVALDGIVLGSVVPGSSLAVATQDLGSPPTGVHELTISGAAAGAATAVIASAQVVAN